MSESLENPIEFSYLIGYVYRLDSSYSLGGGYEWVYDTAVAKSPVEWFIEHSKEYGRTVIMSVLQITEEQEQELVSIGEKKHE